MSQTVNKIVKEREGLESAGKGQASGRPERLRQAFLKGLADEGRMWRRAIVHPALPVLLLGSLLVLALTWQVGFSYKLDSSQDYQLEQPFLKNFNAVENVPKNQPDWFYYRWSKGPAQLDFPGIGKRDYILKVRMANEPNPSPDYFIYANETMIASGKFQPGATDYEFKIPATALTGKSGDLDLRFDVKAFQPKGDERQLGFVLISAELLPAGNGFVIPPVEQLAYLIGVVLLVYLICGRAGFNGWIAAGVGGFVTLVLAYVVATPGARIWLTVFSPQLAFAFGVALLMLVLVDIPLRHVWGERRERAWVLSIFGLALAIKLGGTLHPQIYMVDLGFHYNNFVALWENGEWFRKIKSAEWGSRETYYPPTTYVFAGLFQWLVPDRILLLKLWMCIMEGTRCLLIYYLVKRTLGDGRAAIIAAFMMAVLPVAVISLSFAQVANLFGEWLILAILCLVVAKYEQLRRPPYFVALAFLLLAAFVQHPGVILLSGTVFLLILLLMWRTRQSRQGWTALLACYLIALVLSFAMYHWKTTQEMIPQALQTVSDKISGAPAGEGTDKPVLKVGGSVGDERLGLKRTVVENFSDWWWGGLKGFWSEVLVYYKVIPLLFVPWSFWWLWKTSRPNSPPTEDNISVDKAARRRLFWAGVAWFGVAVVFALLGWTLNLYVRYSLFLLPFVSIGAAIFLARLWKRQGWAAAFLTFVLGAYLTVTTLAMYYDRIIYYGHPR
jgi:4-amino-4-deoxy-L-arabinose transferase-like glycosyltransferase